MAWEDRTKKEKREAKAAARRYKATDDDATYHVISEKGVHATVKGINSARVVAGKNGKITKR